MEHIDRITDINFDSITSLTPAAHLPDARGRNGEIKMQGLEVYTDTIHELVMLAPITSRGVVSKACHLCVPYDKKTLQALAAKFSRLAELAP